MEAILNLTQHCATSQQIKEGVVEPAEKKLVYDLLTFKTLPTYEEIRKRATILAQFAATKGCKKVLIGGAPYLMAPLEKELMRLGLTPVYAFSKREVVEKTMPNGSVKRYKCLSTSVS